MAWTFICWVPYVLRGIHGTWHDSASSVSSPRAAWLKLAFKENAPKDFLPVWRLTLCCRLEHWGLAAFGLVLGIAGHAVGWPIVRGGAQKLSDALAAHLSTLGGEIISSTRVQTLDELPSSRVVLCDLTPRQLLEIAGERFSSRKNLGDIIDTAWALSNWIGLSQVQCPGGPHNALAR